MESELVGWTILIVDDDADNLGVVAEYLQFLGAAVHTAQDGVEGLAELERCDPTVILLDLSMPNMDGWQMFREVRGDPRWAAVPIIALTAHAMAQDRDRVMDEGFDGYITKPFMLTSLLADLKEWVAKAQAAGGLQGS